MADGMDATPKCKCCVANRQLYAEREVSSWQQNIRSRMEQRWATLTTELHSSDLVPMGVGKVKKRRVRKQPRGTCWKTFLRGLLTRRFLGWLSVADHNGRSRFERISETYDRPNVPVGDRLKWALPHLAIDLGLRRTGASKEIAKAKLFHHHPTVRALALTARSIARYGLSAPQRFDAPLFVVWNITRACNLECQHCYENATRKPQRDELTLGEKIGIIDELATAGVPFMAIAGGEPLVCKDLWPVMEYAHKRDIHLTVATNGTMITPEVATRLDRVRREVC